MPLYNLWQPAPGVRCGDQLTVGERAADSVRNGMGSWWFGVRRAGVPRRLGADQVASELAMSDYHTVSDVHELVQEIHTAVVRDGQARP